MEFSSTQVNIRHDGRLLRYRVELYGILSPVTHIGTNYPTYCGLDNNIHYLSYSLLPHTQCVEQGNDYVANTLPARPVTIPQYTSQSTMRVLFPRYSVETFARSLYIVEIYTYISGKKIVLGSVLFDRKDALALEEPIKHKNDEYYEYLDAKIVSPYALVYGSEWSAFRNYLGETNTCSTISSRIFVDLVPVTEKIKNGITVYELTDGFQGGMNAMDVYRENDGLHLTYDENPISGAVLFMKYRLNDIFNTREAIRAIYGDIITPSTNIDFTYYLCDGDEVLKKRTFGVSGWADSNILSVYSLAQGMTWDDYRDGLSFRSRFALYNSFPFLEPVFVADSNEIPVTREMFARMITDPNTPTIDLNSINMNIINIDCVNKVVTETVNVQRPDGYRSNIQQPVFIQALPADGIGLHHGVKENIALNLDRYKAFSEIFFLRINGVDFSEISRNVYGVIFSIDANMLGGAPDEGTYFILDKDRNVVTNGKYTISD